MTVSVHDRLDLERLWNTIAGSTNPRNSLPKVDPVGVGLFLPCPPARVDNTVAFEFADSHAVIHHSVSPVYSL